jgi:parvulin-like peptidyl-prolyl isomerase
LALACLATLVLAGCGDGQLRPGAAALVGEQRISSDTLRQVVDRGLADPQAAQQFGADRAGYQRQILSRLVTREVLEAAAAAEGVTVSPEQVDAQIEQFVEQVGGRPALEEQAAQGGISPADLTDFVRDIVLDTELTAALTADIVVPQADLEAAYAQNLAQYDQVRSAHILVPEEATARMLLEQVQADPSRFAALAAEFSIDTSNKDSGGDLGLAGRGQFVPAFEEVLFSTPSGSFGLAQTQFGWHVIAVGERQITTLAEATPELRSALLQERGQQETQELLSATAERIGVRINPRFGRWNYDANVIEPVTSPNGVLTPAPEEAFPGRLLPRSPAEGEIAPQAPEPAPSATG